jgi:hypothetical protein
MQVAGVSGETRDGREGGRVCFRGSQCIIVLDG